MNEAPASPREHSLDAPAGHPGPARGAGRLLIVDDDPMMTRCVALLARDAFADDALDVTETHTAEDALAAVRAAALDGQPLAVISDFSLSPSGPTGLELLAEVRRLAPHARAALMTGHDPVELGARLREASLDLFLPKPLDARVLVDAIARLVWGDERGTAAA